MNMVKERPSKEWSKVKGMDTEVEHSSKEQPKVEGMDTEDIDMVEDMTVKVEVVKKSTRTWCW
jgi:hypothetical protein